MDVGNIGRQMKCIFEEWNRKNRWLSVYLHCSSAETLGPLVRLSQSNREIEVLEVVLKSPQGVDLEDSRG